MLRSAVPLLAPALQGLAATSPSLWARSAATAASSSSALRLEDPALPPPSFIVGAARPPPTPLDLAAAVAAVQVREGKRSWPTQYLSALLELHACVIGQAN